MDELSEQCLEEFVLVLLRAEFPRDSQVGVISDHLVLGLADYFNFVVRVVPGAIEMFGRVDNSELLLLQLVIVS